MLRRFNAASLTQMTDMFEAGVWQGHKVGVFNLLLLNM